MSKSIKQNKYEIAGFDVVCEDNGHGGGTITVGEHDGSHTREVTEHLYALLRSGQSGAFELHGHSLEFKGSAADASKPQADFDTVSGVVARVAEQFPSMEAWQLFMPQKPGHFETLVARSGKAGEIEFP